MKRRGLILLVALTLAGVVMAAPKKFEKVPSAAMKALKGVKGKPVSSGLVFANGHYLRPPYRIVRLGTAIFINDVQVSNQIVPWKSFLATQAGAVVTAPATPAPAAAKKAEDDLFDDDPAPVKKGGDKEAEKADEPESAVAFEPNAQSKKLVKKINDTRSMIDRTLRGGNILFFGSRYGRVKVDPRLAARLMEVLPEAMSEANDGESLAAMMRAKGFPFMGVELCEDLLDNRKDYLQLIERRNKLAEEAAIQKMIQGS